MKTIELICGEKKVQFTTKSVTFDGKEFFYSNMSNVSHNAEECFYTFTYDGENKALPYEPKDGKILAAIFSQVKMLETKKAEAQTAVKVNKPVTEPNPAVAVSKPSMTEETQAKEVHNAAEPENTADAVDAKYELSAEEKKAAKQAEKENRKAEKLAEKERRKAEKLAKKEKVDTEEANRDDSADLEKKARKKKSFIVFAIVLVVFAVIAAIYFFIFGTAKDPSDIAPNATESQQYDEIDDIINDLQ